MSSMWEYTFVGRGQLKNGVKGMGTYILIEKTSTPTNGFMQGFFYSFWAELSNALRFVSLQQLSKL